MDRKLTIVLLTVAFVALQSIAAMAAGNRDTGPGCGLGKVAWQDYPNQKNIAPQVLMATTNGTFGSTTFGISSGTSGCTSDGVIMAEHKVNTFAAINLDNLSQDMAQGGGEHLASLATLMGVPEEDHPAFFAMTQEKYLSLLEAGETSPVALVRALNEATAAHPVFARASESQ